MPGNFSFLLPGKLAGCARPGRETDLRSDLAGLGRQGITALVSLTEGGLDAKAVADSGMNYLHLPVEDFGVPSQAQIRKFIAFAEAELASGGAVAVHCAAGIGRTGTMLAAYLIHMGNSAKEAIARVRKARPGSIETASQEACLNNFAEVMRKRPARGGDAGKNPPSHPGQARDFQGGGRA